MKRASTLNLLFVWVAWRFVKFNFLWLLCSNDKIAEIAPWNSPCSNLSNKWSMNRMRWLEECPSEKKTNFLDNSRKLRTTFTMRTWLAVVLIHWWHHRGERCRELIPLKKHRCRVIQSPLSDSTEDVKRPGGIQAMQVMVWHAGEQSVSDSHHRRLQIWQKCIKPANWPLER